ncbi:MULTISPECIES: lipopolysaccharide biosynthesis protein [Prevotellaceae]|uniref:lipopolysaccharide biosynthesis protein n=1 Tax=Leyella stercorea TaxID=363265 RepID=UPI001F40D06D|nr:MULTISPECIES: lipopolysaccharide biosynthesis protein [Prevotellaceae]MCF2645941.1 lipopolysaccharide biosynthesis protein [Leyella stercorea]MCI7371331.1 lipopolysaccharide biosynthesis protein [Prevotella sp.]
MSTLKEKTAQGLLWGGLNSGIQQLVGLAFGIVLGRLLAPSDYGMMAMISIFSLVATALQDSGFRTALTNIEHPKHEDYNSVFWFNIIMASSLYVILFLAAPLIGEYYHTPRVVPLCRYAFLSIVIASFGTAQSAYLFKHLRAKQQAEAGALAVILSSLTGVGMAFAGMAYWSLATQGLVYVGINTLLQWHFSPWRPSIHGITFAPVRRMFRFSCKILATTIMTHVNNNVLNILLGHYFTPRDTGNYNQAYQWNTKCYSLVQSMVAQVAQPVLVSLNGEEGRQKDVFRKMMRFTAFITFPLLFGFGLVAKEFIVTAIGEKWLASAQLIQILCISGATMPLSTLFSNMIISKGRSGTFFWCTFTLGLVQIATMIMIWPMGIRTMVIAYTLLNTSWLLVWLFFVRRLIGYGYWMFFCDVMPFALAAAGVMGVAYVATMPLSNLIALLISRFIIAVVLYYAVMKIARVKILAECERFVKRG